jgi:hypothetical protein
MAGHGEKFGRKKEQAIAALLSQRSVEEAARVAGVGINTLRRWLQVPEFQEEYRKARRDTFCQASARLQQASSAAASIILTLMLDATVPATSRLRAAHSVLDHSAKSLELEDLEVRLGRLEGVERSKR